MELTKKQIISIALKEYEESHCSSESQGWQKNINELIEKYK